MNREFDNIKSILLLGDDKIHYEISVVVPTYKRYETLIHLVTAICKQQCDGFEFNIVISDNSDIYTTQLVEQLEKISKQYDKNILYYKNEQNIGMYPNWNRVVELANCDYACLIHADDMVLEGCLQYMWKEMIKLPSKSALVVDRYHVNSSDFASDYKPERITLNKTERRLLKILGYNRHVVHKVKPLDAVLINVPIAPLCLMIEKSLHRDIEGWTELMDGWPGDLEFVLKLSYMGSLYYSDYQYALKRNREHSLSPIVSVPYIYVSNCMIEHYFSPICRLFIRYLNKRKLVQQAKNSFGMADSQIKYLSSSLNMSPKEEKQLQRYKKLLRLFLILR